MNECLLAERERLNAETIRQRQESVREAEELSRTRAEAARVVAETARVAAAKEVRDTVATLTTLVERMEAVETMRADVAWPGQGRIIAIDGVPRPACGADDVCECFLRQFWHDALRGPVCASIARQ